MAPWGRENLIKLEQKKSIQHKKDKKNGSIINNQKIMVIITAITKTVKLITMWKYNHTNDVNNDNFSWKFDLPISYK